MKMPLRFAIIVPVLFSAPVLLAGPLEELKPGRWYEVPNSHLYDVAPPGWSANVMGPWSGGAFDSKRDRLIVWGGGHGDYAGNEIYVFDLNTLQWQRLTDPSANTGGDEATGLYPDGLPRSRHTYNYLEYLPNVDKFITLGGAGQWQGGQTPTQTVSAFDFDSLTWNSSLAKGGGGIGTACAYDAKTGLVWHHNCGSNGVLSGYDPVNDLWSVYSGDGTARSYDFALAIDPVRHVMVGFDGYGGVYSVNLWDLDNPAGRAATLTTVGDKLPETIMQEGAEGFAYDPVCNKFVSWVGGNDIYTLSPPAGATTFSELAAGTWTWKKITPAASSRTLVSPRCGNGTYGRFRYSPSRNVFVVVNGTNTDVYFFKLTPDAMDTLPFAQITGLASMSSGPRQIGLTWERPADSTSGVSHYSVYRDGVLSGITGDTAYTDTGLTENTAYVYEVSATKFFIDLEGPKSQPLNVTTATDTVRPVLENAFSAGDPAGVTLFFSEPLEQESAETAGNYSIDNGIVVQSARLANDKKTVFLAVSAQDTGITYTVAVSNVADNSLAGNLILPSSSRTYRPSLSLVTLVAYYGNYTRPNVLPGGFVNGVAGANDRDWTFNNIPASLTGLDYLQTAQDDKTLARNEDSVMYLVRLSAPCTVYVPMIPPVTWLVPDGWEYTGRKIGNYFVYEKYAPAGEIGLKRKQDPGYSNTPYIFRVAGALNTVSECKAVEQKGVSLVVSPNPFNPEVTLTLAGVLAHDASVKVFDLSGKLVADLSRKISQGRVVWNASGMASGVYVAVAQKGALRLTKKIVYSK